MAAAEHIRLHVLASGSKGNCSIVQLGNRAVMVDCGVCKRDFFDRYDALGVDVSQIEAVLITHEHTDHTKGLGVVMRGLAKQDVHPTVIASDAVRGASRELQALMDTCEMALMRADDALSLGACRCTCSTPATMLPNRSDFASRRPMTCWDI